MAQQQQMAGFLKKRGGLLAEANEEYKEKPVDLGNRRLPSGINNGIARLAAIYTKEQEKEGGMCPKGETFFRVSAIVVSPAEHKGEKIEGLITQIVIPLCDIPAKGKREASPYKVQYGKFQNIMRMLGVAPCPETKATDPTSQKTEQYWLAAIANLNNPINLKTKPIFISFSTRGWVPPATQLQPNPTEMVFEDWHGLADAQTAPDPAAGVSEGVDPSAVQPDRGSAPPSTNGYIPAAPMQDTVAEDDVNGGDLADEVSGLIEVAMDDPQGATDDGAEAAARLEKLAIDAGWTDAQVTAAPDWAAVGHMALNPPTEASKTLGKLLDTAPTVGSKWMYAPRDVSTGKKLTNKNGEEFPAAEVEVTSVDEAAKTCTLKNVKSGKDLIDARKKTKVAIKWEWLENAPPY